MHQSGFLNVSRDNLKFSTKICAAISLWLTFSFSLERGSLQCSTQRNFSFRDLNCPPKALSRIQPRAGNLAPKCKFQVPRGIQPLHQRTRNPNLEKQISQIINQTRWFHPREISKSRQNFSIKLSRAGAKLTNTREFGYKTKNFLE